MFLQKRQSRQVVVSVSIIKCNYDSIAPQGTSGLKHRNRIFQWNNMPKPCQMAEMAIKLIGRQINAALGVSFNGKGFDSVVKKDPDAVSK